MLMVSHYQKKLFWSFAAAMMSIALIIMSSGYFLSKKSTVEKMEQSALLEIKLKKEILTRLMNHSRVTLELSQRPQIVDLLNKSSQMLPCATDFFYLSAAHFGDDLLQMHYVDFKNKRVVHVHKMLTQLNTQISTEDYDEYVSELDTFLAKDPHYVKGLVHFFNTSQHSYFRMATPLTDEMGVILGVISLDLDMKNTFKTLVHSELFDIVLLDKNNHSIDGNLPALIVPENTQNYYLPNALYAAKDPKTNAPRIVWEKGYIYVMDTLLDHTQTQLDIVLRSKSNLSAITQGILKIFTGILILIFVVSLLLSLLISRLHVSLLEKLIIREELLLQEGKLVEIGGMVSYLAHQWKQPINRIASYIACAKGEVLNVTPFHPELVVNDLTTAELELEEMAEHIETFRTFYRFSKEKEFFNVEKELAHIFQMLSYALHMQQIDIEVIVEPKDISLYGLKNEWKHAILSLLNNAIEAFSTCSQKENFKINVHVIHVSKEVIITIDDNAGGIDEALCTELFSKYASSKMAQGGTGLGLYFAKTIVEERFRGKINVSCDTKGTRFTLVFYP